MARSTMLAIMGRMATYTGQTLTWDQCLNSTEDLTPEKYEWGPVPPWPPVAKAGADAVCVSGLPQHPEPREAVLRFGGSFLPGCKRIVGSQSVGDPARPSSDRFSFAPR